MRSWRFYELAPGATRAPREAKEASVAPNALNFETYSRMLLIASL